MCHLQLCSEFYALDETQGSGFGLMQGSPLTFYTFSDPDILFGGRWLVPHPMVLWGYSWFWAHEWSQRCSRITCGSSKQCHLAIETCWRLTPTTPWSQASCVPGEFSALLISWPDVGRDHPSPTDYIFWIVGFEIVFEHHALWDWIHRNALAIFFLCRGNKIKGLVWWIVKKGCMLSRFILIWKITSILTHSHEKSLRQLIEKKTYSNETPNVKTKQKKRVCAYR